MSVACSELCSACPVVVSYSFAHLVTSPGYLIVTSHLALPVRLIFDFQFTVCYCFILVI